jgi:hypothetical protein
MSSPTKTIREKDGGRRAEQLKCDAGALAYPNKSCNPWYRAADAGEADSGHRPNVPGLRP